MSNINDQNTKTSDKTITNSDNDSGKTNPNSGKTTTISNNNNNVPPIQSHKHNHIGILPIQPNIPSNFILTRSNSRRIVSQKSVPTFPTKTLRMKSLLWTKPTGVAIDCWPSTIKQVIAALIVNMAALSSGLSLGFSAIVLPQLKANLTENPNLYQPFHLNMESGSWVASIFGIGAIFGGFATAYLGSKFGRRQALVMMAIPDLIGWILIASSQNLPMMLIGRFLSGFCAAGYSPSIQIYIAEIAQPQHRGWLAGITTPTLAFGALISYALGAMVSWHYVAIFGAFIPLAMLPGLLFLHDSPYWYLQNANEKKALQVMENFRSKSSNCLGELLAISDSLQTTADEYTLKESISNLTRRQYRRPFLILNFLFILMTFSGNFAITFYAVDIFQNVSPFVNEYLSAVIIGIIKFVGALLYIPAIKYVSRRILICGSAFVMGISMAILGLAMYSHETGLLHMDNFTWLPLLCVTIYMIADPVGLGSVPFLYIGEFFPTEMRSLLSGITVGLANLELFIVVKTFPNLTHMMGDSGTFWLYAGSCFVTILFTLVWIPETKGRSLQDIEEYFSYKENKHVSPFPSPVTTPVGTPSTSKRGLAPYPLLAAQFTV